MDTAVGEATEVKKMADENADKILRLNSTIESLVTASKYQANQINYLTENVESRTNRQMRNTLVFKGIPESKEEKSWEQTRTVLAATVSKCIPRLSKDDAYNIFECVHRGRPNNRTPGKRNTFAKLCRWDDAESLKSDFRKLNINDKNLKIYCEQKFGPLTTFRRNHAMAVRRKLMDDKAIFSGYVAFPAKLLVKKSRDKNEKYILYEDFSKMEVSFSGVDAVDDSN